MLDDTKKDPFGNVLRPSPACDESETLSWKPPKLNTPIQSKHEDLRVLLSAFRGNPRFYQLLAKMAEIHEAKNQDYGDGDPLGNFYRSSDVGVEPFKGVLVRLSDKWTRICTLAKKVDARGEVKEESIIDTLIDMANYAIIAATIFEREYGHENRKEADGADCDGNCSKNACGPECPSYSASGGGDRG